MKCDHLIAIASVGGGNPNQLYNLKLAYRFPIEVATPTIDVHDQDGRPMIVNGVPVFMELAPCVPGLCEVDRLHPAPPGQRWVQYQSIKPLPPSEGGGELHMVVEVNFPVDLGRGGGNCAAAGLSGTLFGAWHSDDRDDRYGIEVLDYFGEMEVGASSFDAVRPEAAPADPGPR